MNADSGRFASGTLACAIGCGFDTSGCVGFPPPPPDELCGNGVRDEDEDCDGATDDVDARESAAEETATLRGDHDQRCQASV